MSNIAKNRCKVAEIIEISFMSRIKKYLKSQIINITHDNQTILQKLSFLIIIERLSCLNLK